MRITTEQKNSGRLNLREVHRYLGSVQTPTAIVPVRLTVLVYKNGRQHVYDVQPIGHKKTLPNEGPGGKDPGAPTVKQRTPTVRDLLPDVKEDGSDLFTADFAQTTTAPEPTDNATIERELTALRRALPKLAELFKLRIGSIQSEFDQAGYKGQIPSNVEAAVWGQKRLIVIAARAWRDRNNGAALVTHEVAHLFWDTLPTAAKTQLRALHAKETGTKTGPLYTDQGFMRGSIQFERDRLPVARVAADPDLPVKEWFAERIAIINKAWAEGRLDRTETPLLRRLADDLRQLWRRIVEAFAIRSNIDPDSELFEAQFRAFILAGADVQIGRNAGTSYAQKKAQFAQRPDFATGKRPLTLKTKLALETKFDQVVRRERLKQNDIYVGEFGALTEAEGRWLVAAKTLDAAGNRLVAQRRQGDASGIAGVLRPSAPPAVPSVEFATSVNAYVAANDTPPDKIAAARTDITQILGVVRDKQLELVSYDRGSDLLRPNPDSAGSVGDTPAALQRAAAALKAPNQPDAVQAAYGIDPRDLDYAGSAARGRRGHAARPTAASQKPSWYPVTAIVSDKA